MNMHSAIHAPKPAGLSYISSLPDIAWQKQTPRTVAILGSTGSIGCSALSVLRLQPERFHVAALAAGRNIPLLAKQATEWRPDHLGVLEAADIPTLRKLLPAGYAPAIVSGQEGYEALAGLSGVSTVLSAQSGAAGLRATFAAVEAGKVVALANKESLVLAGGLIRAACARSGANILPVDSEHSAIFQCLTESFLRRYRSFYSTQTPQAAPPPPGDASVAKLILTASGGPFFGKSLDALARVTVEQALAHPNWTMGAKITVDSSTLMNKGLELIEAHHLYGLPMSSIDVLVHTESIIHSLVEYIDGSQLAQLSQPDMRIAIAHCLGWPERLETSVPRLRLTDLGALTFSRPDEEAFPCLGLARHAQERGRGSPVVLNAANEEAVAAFLDRRISYLSIAESVSRSLAHYEARTYDYTAAQDPDSIEAVLALDAEARIRAREIILTLGKR